MPLQQQHAPPKLILQDNKTLFKHESFDNLTVTTASTSAHQSLNDDWTFASFFQFVQQKQDAGNKAKTDWAKIQPGDVKTMPSYFTYDNDAVAMCPIQYTKKVIPRMINLFRFLSLMVVYTNSSSHNSPYAICEDMDGVRFHVLLWKNITKTNVQELMVEVRHVGGESMLYHERQYKQRVLQAVYDSCIDDMTNRHKPPPKMSYLPMDPLLFNMKGRDEQIASQDSLNRRSGDHTSNEEHLNEIIDRIEDFMSGDFLENVYEGLSILLHVTNANHSGYRISEAMSKILLTGTTSMTSKMTLSLGLRECWYTEIELKKHDARRDETIIKDYSLLALRIIGQAVNLLDNPSMNLFVSNATSIMTNDSRSLVSALYQHIVHAEEKPHVAYCAAHILARICENVPAIRSVVQDDPDCVPNIQKAATFGMTNHVSLELASKRLLSIVRVSD
jgi:hypothetical protein